MILEALIVKHHRGLPHIALEGLPERGVVGLKQPPRGFSLGRLVLEALLGTEEAAGLTGEPAPLAHSSLHTTQITFRTADGKRVEIVREFESDGSRFLQVRNVTDRTILARGDEVRPVVAALLGTDPAGFLAMAMPWLETAIRPSRARVEGPWRPSPAWLSFHRLRLERAWATLGSLAAAHEELSGASRRDHAAIDERLIHLRAARAALETRRARLGELGRLLRLREVDLARELKNDLRDLDLEAEGDFVPPHGRAEQLHVVEKRLEATEAAQRTASRRVSGWTAAALVLIPVTVWEIMTFGTWRLLLMAPLVDLLSLAMVLVSLGAIGRAWSAMRDRRRLAAWRDRLETSRSILEDSFLEARRAHEACVGFSPDQVSSLRDVPELASAPGIHELLVELERPLPGADPATGRLPELSRLEQEENQLVAERDRRDRWVREIRAREVCLRLARASLESLEPVRRLEEARRLAGEGDAVPSGPATAPAWSGPVSDEVELHLARLLAEIHRSVLVLTGAGEGTWWGPRREVEASLLAATPPEEQATVRMLAETPVVMGPDLPASLDRLDAIRGSLERVLGPGAEAGRGPVTSAWAAIAELMAGDEVGRRTRRVESLGEALAAREGEGPGGGPVQLLILEPMPLLAPGRDPAAWRQFLEPIARQGLQVFVSPVGPGLEKICDHVIEVSPTGTEATRP